MLGESKTAKRHRVEFLQLLAPARKYGGKMVMEIRKHVEERVLPLSSHTWYWQRAMRWVKEFGEFAVTLLRDEVASGERESEGNTDLRYLLGDQEMLELFVAALTLKEVGFSVPRAARRFLSASRMRIGHRSLNELKTLSEVIRGHERSTPRTKIQAESLERGDVERITEAYGCSRCWWEVQVVTMIALGFIAILRLGELVVLNVEDVVIVMKDGREVNESRMQACPRRGKVRGVFLHIRWRKAGQCHSVWIPVACPTAVALLLRHLHMLKAEGRVTGCLFPARVGRVQPKRNEVNHVSTTSLKNALRKALHDVCGLTWEQASLYKGHSLRVEGLTTCECWGLPTKSTA